MSGSSGTKPPSRIVTERLVIRRWEETDAELAREAIASSLDHLRPWMPWAMDEPKSLEETVTRIRNDQERFASGSDFTFAILDAGESRILGACGLHRRIGEGGLEIGYWIRADEINQGLATEASRALTSTALLLPGIDRVQIHCDPENVASARVPEKLGFRMIERRRADKETSSGAPRDTLVFEMTPERWRAENHGGRVRSDLLEGGVARSGYTEHPP
jgi:RimJ/RimL family protein N-acetyltransferase